jgi:hypothetical protein
MSREDWIELGILVAATVAGYAAFRLTAGFLTALAAPPLPVLPRCPMEAPPAPAAAAAP